MALNDQGQRHIGELDRPEARVLGGLELDPTEHELRQTVATLSVLREDFTSRHCRG